LGTFYAKGEVHARNNVIASELYQKSCDGDYLEACYNLGVILYEGIGVIKDTSKSTSLFTKSCNGNIAEACVRLGALHEAASDSLPHLKVNALAFYSKGCDLKNQIGCSNLKNLIDKMAK
jgi:TPR repeat protein